MQLGGVNASGGHSGLPRSEGTLDLACQKGPGSASWCTSSWTDGFARLVEYSSHRCRIHLEVCGDGGERVTPAISGGCLGDVFGSHLPEDHPTRDAAALKVVGDRAVMHIELTGQVPQRSAGLVAGNKGFDVGWSKASTYPESCRV